MPVRMVVTFQLKPGTAKAYSEAFAPVARETNKPMMLDFWADWCAACIEMEKAVYPDLGVLAVSPKFVFVKIDFDRQPELARRYGIEALPVLLFTNSRGLEIFRHRGLINARGLAEVLQALPADVTELNRLGQMLSADKNSFEALQGLARELRAASLYLTSNEYYKKALDKDPARKNAPLREALLLELGLNYLELKESKAAVQTFERCLREFPNSPNQPKFRLSLGEAYAISYSLGQKKDREKAKQALHTLLQSFPDPAISQKARHLLQELDSREGD